MYSGDDATGLALMLLGGHGIISVTANVAPRLMHEMCAAALAGELARARDSTTSCSACTSNLFVEANPIPVKWAVAQIGLIEGGIRLPLTPLSAQFHETVREAMREAGSAASSKRPAPRGGSSGMKRSTRAFLAALPVPVARRRLRSIGEMLEGGKKIDYKSAGQAAAAGGSARSDAAGPRRPLRGAGCRARAARRRSRPTTRSARRRAARDRGAAGHRENVRIERDGNQR